MIAKRRKPIARTRATNESAKLARRALLMRAAADLFSARVYKSVSIEEIAAAAGVAKGTFYLYFGTKEAVFLEIVAEALADWVKEAGEPFKQAEKPPGPRQLAAKMTSALATRPELIRLLGLAHAVLEQNARMAELRAFKHRMLEVTSRAATLFEDILQLPPGSGVRLAFWTHALIVGLGQMTFVDPVSAKLLEEDRALRVFRLDFAAELQAALTAMFAGAVENARGIKHQ